MSWSLKKGCWGCTPGAACTDYAKTVLLAVDGTVWIEPVTVGYKGLL